MPKEIEVAVTVRRLQDSSIAVADGTTEEHMDPRTGEITEREKFFWLPKSKIVSVEPEHYDVGSSVVVTIPTWIARDRGLI